MCSAQSIRPQGSACSAACRTGPAEVVTLGRASKNRRLGRITQRVETIDGITRVFEYGYDLAGRLTIVRRNGTMVVLYTYDSNGNRLVAEGEAGLFEGTYDAQDRALTYGNASYTYTANGGLATKTVAGQTTSYVYDTLGNLTQVTKPNGAVITYTVDGRGRRVRKAIDGIPVKGWLYADQLRPIAELDGAGDVISRFVYGTRPNVPEYVIKNGVTYRIFSDHLGSPRIVVNATTGDVVQRMDFQPFGEIIQDSSPGWQPFGFAGGLYDPDTGILRFGARDYDPQLGRWISKDPILFEAADGNLYRYAGGDAMNVIDPTGLCFWTNVKANFVETNKFFFAGPGRVLRSAMGIATSSAYARSTGLTSVGMALGDLIRGQGVANLTFGQTLVSVAANSVLNAATSIVTLEVGIGMGSVIRAGYDTLVGGGCPAEVTAVCR